MFWKDYQTVRERIDAMIPGDVKNAPPPLSVEEQRKKNQTAIEMLRQWREEDKTDLAKDWLRPEDDEAWKHL